MLNKIPILCTRPLSKQLLLMAEQKGFQIDIVPFIKTERIESKELTNRIHYFSSQSIIAVFTSMNAAQAVISQLNGFKPLWKIFCIGNTTRNTLIQYFGEEMMAGFSSRAAALADTIIEAGNINHVVFFCGDQRREELPHILATNQIPVEEVTVYRTIPVNNIIRRHYQGILFFSPSAVTSFFANNTAGSRTILFAIGETTAGTLRTCSDNTIVIGEEASKENLVYTMIEYYQSLEQQKLSGTN